jgi:hypothetical protein
MPAVDVTKVAAFLNLDERRIGAAHWEVLLYVRTAV